MRQLNLNYNNGLAIEMKFDCISNTGNFFEKLNPLEESKTWAVYKNRENKLVGFIENKITSSFHDISSWTIANWYYNSITKEVFSLQNAYEGVKIKEQKIVHNGEILAH